MGGHLMSALRIAMRHRARRRESRVRQGNRGGRRVMVFALAAMGALAMIGFMAVSSLVMFGAQQ